MIIPRAVPAGRRLVGVLLAGVLAACGVPAEVSETGGGAVTPTEQPTGGGTTGPTPTTPAAAQRFPDVVDATLEATGETWTLSAAISSPYDSAERYADAFRAVTHDGTVLGVRELTHPHQDEQPFTRSLTGLEIPADVDTIVVEARDLANGWGGATVTLDVPR